MAWPRRRRQFGEPNIRTKSVLGSTYLATAERKIESLFQRSVKVMAPFDYDMPAVLPWCFSEDTRLTLTHAHSLVKLNLYYGGLATTGSYKIVEGTGLSVDFASIPMLAPKEELFEVDEDSGRPLLEIIEQIKAIKNKFDLAEHVLNWLDGHVTAGAMPYYWPTVLSLAPGAPALNTEAPSRFNTPGNITPFLPFIRESASTIASALMLAEDIDTAPKNAMTLQLAGGGMKVGEDTLAGIKRSVHI